MRHQNTGRQLSRNSSHREALMQNMAAALLRYETIRTTVPKAKELRRVVEPLITLAKQDNVAKRRLAYARLRDDEIVAKLFNDLGPHFKDRPGGYTRILKHGFRPGDKAPMAVMQLVDREAAAAVETAVEKSAEKKARTEKQPKAEKVAKAEKPRKAGKQEAATKPKADKKAKAEKEPVKSAKKAATKKAAKKSAK